MERAAFIHFDGWAGRTKHPVFIIGETPKRYRVRLVEKTKLAGRNRWKDAGEVVLVPKYSVSFAEANNV